MEEPRLLDAETKAAFDMVDDDHDGLISHDQLRVSLRQLTGVKKLPAAVVDGVLAQADEDNNGVINYEGFCHAIATCTLLETIIRLFIQCDRDRSGYLSPSELRAAISNLPAAPHDQEHVDELLKQCDVNEDGLVSFEEFAYHMLDEAQQQQKD